MRVGVYVDGFNLYYGARELCGRGRAGWRWLDLEALATDLIGRRKNWAAAGATLERLVFCTARIDKRDNPVGRSEQDVYLLALSASGSVTHVEYGQYVSRVKKGPLATEDAKGRPILTEAKDWPAKVKDGNHADVQKPDSWSRTHVGRRRVRTSTLHRTC